MLKSLSTQFVATLFFGPLGLAYSSVAAAVFLTLILAVLYFTELSILSVAIAWPIAIVTGLVLVKLHNDQIRSSGSSLLLSPEEEEGEVISTFGSWGRGVAVLSMLAIGGYAAYWYSGQSTIGGATDRVASESSTDSTLTGSADSSVVADSGALNNNLPGNDQFDNGQVDSQSNGQGNGQITSDGELAIAKTYPIDGDDFTGSSFQTSATESGSTFTVLTSDQQGVEPVIIGTSSQPEVLSGNLLYVDSELVNLRDGPGTNFSIREQVERGAELAEVERAGSWIRVTATGSGASGWIFSRLVSTQP